MVAVGNLDKVWLDVPEDASASELDAAFRDFFGADWADVLDSAEGSFAYRAHNSGYFAVRGLRSLDGLTLEDLPGAREGRRPLNLIAS